MKKQTGKLAKSILTTSLAVILGGLALSSVAEEDYGYCAISACSHDKSSIKAFFGMGEAKLSWWDCRVQGECAKIRKDLTKLKVTSADCSKEKLDKYEKDIKKLDERLMAIAKKIDAKAETIPENTMEENLNNDMWAHFAKCYKEGLFKPDTKDCLTPYCKEMVAKIDQLKVNEEDCRSDLDALNPNPAQVENFPFEADLITNRLVAFKDKCTETGMVPAYVVFGREVTKENVGFAKECEEKGDKIKSRIEKLRVTAVDCSKKAYESLHKDLDDFEADILKLFDKSKKAANSDEDASANVEVMKKKVDEHFKKCEMHGLTFHL